MTQPPYQIEIVPHERGLSGLKSEWDALYAAQASPHLSDSFDWAWLSWNAVASGRGRRPYCVVVRRAGRAVAIWPLVITPGPLLNVASPMNSETSEYCPCLLDPGEPPAALWTALRRELRTRRDADALRLPHVRRDTALHAAISGVPEARATVVQPAPLVRAQDFPTSEDYQAWLAGDARASLRRRRRRLGETGRVDFQVITCPRERLDALDWVLARKSAWLQRRGLANERLLSRRNTAFLEATLDHEWSSGGRAVFALKLDGALIAAEVASVDGSRVESFTSSFDPAFERYSPGALLTQEVIRWALDRRLDYDFRAGAEPYKFKWSSHVTPVTSYLLPITFRGEHFVRYRLARRWLSARAPKRLRGRISRLRAQLWRRP